MCYCPDWTVSTEEQCANLEHKNYTFQWTSSTCAKKAMEWTWDNNNADDLVTKCIEDTSDFSKYTPACCTDGLSVCDSEVSKVCLHNNSFDPTKNVDTGDCYWYATDSQLDQNMKDAFSCPEGCAKYCPGCTYDEGDGKYHCWCSDIVSNETECHAIDHTVGGVKMSMMW